VFAAPKGHQIPPPAAAGPITTPDEEKQVEERAAIGAHVVYEAVRREGEEELQRPSTALAWSGLAAGLSMGFSFVAEALLMAYLPEAPWRPLISRLGYSVGFVIVILGRQQLYTENTLTVILPLLLHKNARTLFHVARLWSVVLVANTVGTVCFAYAISKLPVFDARVHEMLGEIGGQHLGMSFGVIFVKAIFAGWLIALMVWLLPGAEASRLPVIVIITYIIGLAGFSHIIAGSTTVMFLVVGKTISLGQYFTGFYIPTLLGNAIGGVSLVAALAHGQVVSGKP
jgi:formate-nitrite transporter family protein